MPVADGGSAAARRVVAIGSHLQIHPLRRPWASGITEVQIQARLPLKLLQQQGHQGAVLQDPTHSHSCPSSGATGQITPQKRHPPLQGLIAKLQAAKRRQMRLQGLPEIQALQQLSTGVGERIGTAALEQGRGG